MVLARDFFCRCFYLKKKLSSAKSSLLSVYHECLFNSHRLIWWYDFFFFSLLSRWITLFDFWIMNQPCILYWTTSQLDVVNNCIHCYFQFFKILLRIFVPKFMREFVYSFLFCAVCWCWYWPHKKNYSPFFYSLKKSI